ncbi:16S rRNA (guanine(527)-N(7))-methyltransferase RsmG [Alicyclobacillus mengziensis]|uniref:Ribosomal RNA small subunit methyltransferase G n=2 Tax=Alicyclobacillus mengziensis TaxID=2931921 RepID=A0A9X7VZH6_9BACL|nr:16S rRNA (guanine(527)-N(7))-methyltransferase RsmG [Alicyclobacillus mengziensis]
MPMDEYHDLRVAFSGLTDAQWLNLHRYYELLVEWNAHMNLTAITEPVEVYMKHFYDSLLILQAEDTRQVFEAAQHVVDVGTGAGFPGLVLAMVVQDKQFVLVDALTKRLKFLEAVCTELGLDHVELVHGRAEDIGQRSGFRESFDLVVSRAVARLSVLAELTLPLVRVGGWVISYKGPSASEELSEAQTALARLGGKEAFARSLELPGNRGMRVFVGLSKVSRTPKQYPRKAGTPQKNPL